MGTVMKEARDYAHTQVHRARRPAGRRGVSTRGGGSHCYHHPEVLLMVIKFPRT